MDRDDPAARQPARRLTTTPDWHERVAGHNGSAGERVFESEVPADPPARTAGGSAGPALSRIHEFVDLVATAARSPRHRDRMLRAAGAPITGASLTVLQ
nr:hypothetical protein [Micromonospora sp. DSM 115978]